MSRTIPSTVTEQIEQINKEELTYRTLHDRVLIRDEKLERTIAVPYSSVTEKYENFLYGAVVIVSFMNKDTEKYKYNPKKLSLDLYGTTEYWNDILILNDCFSILDFVPTVIKVYDPSIFKEYLNEVVITNSMSE